LLQNRLQLGSHKSKDLSGSRQGFQGEPLDRALPGNCVSPKFIQNAIDNQLKHLIITPFVFMGWAAWISASPF
jgi:hypothetical protein